MGPNQRGGFSAQGFLIQPGSGHWHLTARDADSSYLPVFRRLFIGGCRLVCWCIIARLTDHFDIGVRFENAPHNLAKHGVVVDDK
jgi:hypothetical protein